jgi:hypothetical protein
MGCDLILAGIPACNPTEERTAALKAVFSDMTQEELEDLIDRCILDEDNIVECGDCNVFPCKCKDPKIPESCILQMHEFVDRWSEIAHGTRMTAELTYGNPYHKWLITGGGSWGDQPTSEMPIMDAVAALDRTYDLLEQWAIEDHIGLLKACDTLWSNDEIQFARLIGELCAVDLGEYLWDELLENMDLESDELSQLFERGQKRWDQIKAAT